MSVPTVVIYFALYFMTECSIFTGRNEVVAKVMFLHVSVILSTGGEGGLQQGEPPSRETPWQGDTPLAGRTPPSPSKENPPSG